MKRSIRIFIASVVVLSMIAFVLYDPALRVRGWVGGQPFYAGRAAVAWERDLLSTDGTTRTTAVTALVDGKGEAIPICTWILKNSSYSSARFAAADALSKMGKDASPAAPALVEVLENDKDGAVREVTIMAVSKLAPDVPGGVPALVKLFPKDIAVHAIAEFGPAGAEAVPALIGLLQNTDPKLRWYAARSLGRIGEPALAAVPGLVKQLTDDKEWQVREQAAAALGQIGPKSATADPEVIPALVKALKDANERVRREAVHSLGQMGKAAQPVIDDVKKLRDDPAPGVKDAANDAVKAIELTK